MYNMCIQYGLNIKYTITHTLISLKNMVPHTAASNAGPWKGTWNHNNNHWAFTRLYLYYVQIRLTYSSDYWETDGLREHSICYEPADISWTPHDARDESWQYGSWVQLWLVRRPCTVDQEVTCAGQVDATEVCKHIVQPWTPSIILVLV